nr:MAG TPA: hypothetical protein [Myoviridae sp. ct1TR10]
MAVKRYNATLRNLEYRLRAFKDSLPMLLEDIVRDKEDVIVSAIADDQLYRRGINGKGQKIMDYMPYAERTIKNKRRKGQPTTRVTLRDTGAFHESMYVVFDSEGFYITASDDKTEKLVDKYGEEIFRLTNKNFTRIIRSHIRKELTKRLKRAIRQ